MWRDQHQAARWCLEQAAALLKALPSGAPDGDGRGETGERQAGEAGEQGRRRREAKPEKRSLAGSRPTPLPGYVTPSAAVPGSFIGNHIRHSLDHFSRIWRDSPATLSSPNSSQASLDMASAYWPVNYDQRSRTGVDTDPVAALDEIARLLILLEAHRSVPPEMPVQVTATADPAEQDGVTVGSTYGRELWFCCVHSVHHFALINAICLEHGIPLPADFRSANLHNV